MPVECGGGPAESSTARAKRKPELGARLLARVLEIDRGVRRRGDRGRSGDKNAAAPRGRRPWCAWRVHFPCLDASPAGGHASPGPCAAQRKRLSPGSRQKSRAHPYQSSGRTFSRRGCQWRCNAPGGDSVASRRARGDARGTREPAGAALRGRVRGRQVGAARPPRPARPATAARECSAPAPPRSLASTPSDVAFALTGHRSPGAGDEVRTIFGGEPPDASDRPQRGRRWCVRWPTAMERSPTRTGCSWCVDDVHLADAPSLELLAHLAAHAGTPSRSLTADRRGRASRRPSRALARRRRRRRSRSSRSTCEAAQELVEREVPASARPAA